MPSRLFKQAQTLACAFVLLGVTSLGHADDNAECQGLTSNDCSACLAQVESQARADLAQTIEKITPAVHERLQSIDPNWDGPADPMLLEKSQAYWEKYVVSQCELEGHLQGRGIRATIIATQCRIKGTRNRAQLLSTMSLGG